MMAFYFVTTCLIYQATPALVDDSAFDGTWELVSQNRNGEAVSPRNVVLTIRNGTWQEVIGGEKIGWSIRRTAGDPWPQIQRSTWEHKGSGVQLRTRERGIYRLEGDRLTLCLVPRMDPVPADFEPGPRRWVEVYRWVRR